MTYPPPAPPQPGWSRKRKWLVGGAAAFVLLAIGAAVGGGQKGTGTPGAAPAAPIVASAAAAVGTPAAAAAMPTPPPIASTTPTAPAKPVRMPALKGTSVQHAYDVLPQGTTINPADVSGRDRVVIVPTHWEICTQTPAAGGTLEPGTPVELGVVKYGEPCP